MCSVLRPGSNGGAAHTSGMMMMMSVARSLCAYERCAAAAVNIGFAYAQGSQCGSNRLNVVVPTTNCREVYRL